MYVFKSSSNLALKAMLAASTWSRPIRGRNAIFCPKFQLHGVVPLQSDSNTITNMLDNTCIQQTLRHYLETAASKLSGRDKSSNFTRDHYLGRNDGKSGYEDVQAVATNLEEIE